MYERIIRKGSMLILAAVLLAAAEAEAGLAITKHNLASWSPYDIKAANESRLCVFCHTPHNAESTQAPLWGHEETTATFTVVSSAHTGGPAEGNSQPTGISKKCLSCHDGTISIGALLNGQTIAMTGSTLDPDGSMSSTTPGYLGTNLRNTHFHPISFIYEVAAAAANTDAPGTFVTPISAYNKKTMLDRYGKVQCHTCHNPHNDGGTSTLIGRAADNDPLWRKDLDCNGDNASVCGACHEANRDPFCPSSDYDQ